MSKGPGVGRDFTGNWRSPQTAVAKCKLGGGLLAGHRRVPGGRVSLEGAQEFRRWYVPPVGTHPWQ